MPWQTTPLTYPLLSAAGASFVVGVYVAVRSHERPARQSARSFVWLAMTASLLSLSYCLRISSVGRPEKLFWMRVTWIAIVFVGIAWPAFVFSYTGGVRWSRTRFLAALSIVPGLGVFLALSDFFQSYLLDTDTLVVADWGVQLVGGFSPLGSMLIGYTAAVYLVATSRLAKTALDVAGIHRRQAALLLAAGLTPLVLSVVDAVRFGSLGYLPVSPISLSLTSILIGWALVRYRLLDIVPVARETVLAEMDDGLIVLDADRRIVDLNGQARAILGVDEGATGDPAATALSDHPALADVLDGDDRRDLTVEMGDGIRHYDVKSSALTDDSDFVYGHAVVLRDVTERRAVERRFRTLIEKTPNVVLVLDETGTVRYASPSVERVLGYDPDDLRGKDAFELIHPDDREEITGRFASLVDGGQLRRNEFRVKRDDGTWRVIESVSENLLGDPHIDGIVVTIRDVTDQRRYEQRLQVLNRVLRHDLLNDVNVIQGYAHLLRDRLDDPENVELLDVVVEKSDAMENLSHQARRVDRLLHGGNDATRFDVESFVAEKVASFGRSHPDATFATAVDIDAAVHADVLLDSALDNVLRNAIQHSDRESPSIRVSAERVEVAGERYVDLSVADDGPGIPEMDRMVMERGAETQLEHASGLGLWLVNWIVSQSDGELRIEDNDPRGSVIVFRLREADPADEADSDGDSGVEIGDDSDGDPGIDSDGDSAVDHGSAVDLRIPFADRRG